jgi:hypothetical protein
MKKRKLTTTLCIALITLFVAGPAVADDITDSIKEALDYYKNGDFTEAVSNLNYAAQLIQQKKGGSLESFLPEPLKGWKAEDTSSQAAAAGIFGGVTAEREYTKGDASVSVTIVTDSPMIQGMAVMFTNPAFAVSDGGKMEKIAGQRAIVKYSSADKSGDIQIMVASRFLISIDGSDVNKSELKKYAAGINYKKLAAMP